ncbi:MAG TPA: thioredoxin-dependent thiol peroxidase [Candidatus Binataceae bacterium]|nr:thioredoxin-dependent thiol peroxidase [Candidatus Binataceae bacterium]
MATKKKSQPTAGKRPAKPLSKKAPGNDSLKLEGKAAPAFVLPDADGQSVALKDMIGKRNLVLYFYPKDMTPGCTVEACSFRDNSDRLQALGASVVGISADSSALHTKFTEKHSLNFPLLADPENKVTRAYGVYKKKSLYGHEFMGIERTTFIIDKSGVIRKVFSKVKVDGHTDEVIAALKALR